MKRLYAFSDLLDQVEQLLTARYPVGVRLRPIPQVQHAAWGPLSQVLAVVCEGRRYLRVELSLKLDERHPPAKVSAEALPSDSRSAAGPGGVGSDLIVPLRAGGHEFGELHVIASPTDALGPADRVFLKEVARRLATFLGGDGRYILTRARLEGARRQP